MPAIEPLFFLSAFIAGTLMFLAPCTLPLLPAYLGFISGVTERELREGSQRYLARKKVVKHSAFFVTGFSVILVTLGIVAGVSGSFFTTFFGRALPVVGGSLIIFFGLFLIGSVRSKTLTKERRISIPSRFAVGSPISSFLLGAAFAVGWTPCVGPVYGTILIYASTTQTVMTGAALLGVFALGFSIPFLLFAVLISQATRMVERLLPFLKVLSFLGGVMLIVIGLSLVLGDSMLTDWFYRLFGYLDFNELLLPYL